MTREMQQEPRDADVKGNSEKRVLEGDREGVSSELGTLVSQKPRDQPGSLREGCCQLPEHKIANNGLVETHAPGLAR